MERKTEETSKEIEEAQAVAVAVAAVVGQDSSEVEDKIIGVMMTFLVAEQVKWILLFCWSSWEIFKI